MYSVNLGLTYDHFFRMTEVISIYTSKKSIDHRNTPCKTEKLAKLSVCE